MGLKHHTIIVIPHERAQFRKWRVSNTQIVVATSTLCLLLLAAGLTTWSFFTTTVDQRELSHMRDENNRLRQANQSFEDGIKKLRLQLSDYEDRTRKLAIVAGLDSVAGGTAGVGGSEISAAPDARGISSLNARADTLRGSLDRVEAKLEEQSRWISSTPTIAPVRGILTSAFGGRRDPFNGHAANHPAIDIAAAPGKSVVATADGIVTRAGNGGDGLGISIFLSHGFGVLTRYGHLSRMNVVPGQKVHRGDVIGFVGSTGRSTGYHLHYEVVVDGQSVNPLAYILDSGTS